MNEQKKIIKGKIIKITQTYVLVNFANKVGICHISNVSDYLVPNINIFFKLNKVCDFQIINETLDGKINLSFKAIHPIYLKYHENPIPTPAGFKNLKDNFDKLIEKI